MSCKEDGDAELYEKIKKLTDKEEEDERLEKLREEAAKLECRKKLKEEARAQGVTRIEGVTRMVVKVPQPPPLPPTDNDNKWKTRNMCA